VATNSARSLLAACTIGALVPITAYPAGAAARAALRPASAGSCPVQPISGTYFDHSGVAHGFVYADGKYKTIDDPGASARQGGTYGAGINDSGEVVGFYYDKAGMSHGFIDKEGAFTRVDAPGAGTGNGQGTLVWSVTDSGALVGDVIGSTGLAHGFVDSGGAFTTLTDPEAAKVDQKTTNPYLSGFPNWGTFALGEVGATVWGFYVDSKGVTHGFLYQRKQWETVDDPSAPLVPLGGTTLGGVNKSGEAAGYYADRNGVFHGYVESNGTFSTLNDPEAGTKTGQGTELGFVTNAGSVVGDYVDSKETTYTFVYRDGSYSTLPSPAGSTGTIPYATPPGERC